MAGEFIFKSVTIIVLHSVYVCHGADLVFVVEPRNPTELVTPLKMFCAYESFGDDKEEEDTDEENHFYPYNISILNEKGTILATISLDDEPDADHDNASLKVKGQHSWKKSDTDLKLIVNLAWERSRRDLEGPYICQARAREEGGPDVIKESRVDVSVRRPHRREVVTYLGLRDKAVDEMEHTVQKYETKFAQLSEQLADFTNSLRNATEDIEELKLKIGSRVETGLTSCGHGVGEPRNESTGGDHIYWEAPVAFRAPFRRTPTVSYSTRHLETRHVETGSLWYRLTLNELNGDGFNLICNSTKKSHFLSVEVSWLAYGV